MKGKILKITVAIALLFSLLVSDFLFVGYNLISYANDEASTNHNNVSFFAYFKNEDGQKTQKIDAQTNDEEIKLYMEIGVKQEGYFVGNITVDTTNFKLKPDIESDKVNKIEGNTIVLNQINAGETVELEFGIECITDLEFDLDLLNSETKISILGTYKDSTQKDIEIKADKKVELDFVNPYSESILQEDIITNKIANYEGEQKRIIQTKVVSGLENNLFPVNSVEIETEVPAVGGNSPEKILVETIGKCATNNKKIEDDNWNFDEETGTLKIKIENEAVDNKVVWNKESYDEIILTYIYSETNIDLIEETTLMANSKITLYDKSKTIIENTASVVVDKNTRDSLVSVEIQNEEDSIYKGKLNQQIERTLREDVSVKIIAPSMIDVITLSENSKEQSLSNVYTTQTIFNKNNIQEILGENGIVYVYNKQTSDELFSVNGFGNFEVNENKISVENENDEIIFSYKEDILELMFEIKNVEAVGNLEFVNVRTIKANDSNAVANASNIFYTIESSYTENEEQYSLEKASSEVKLLDTKTSASLEMNKTQFSTIRASENVEFRVNLQTSSEEDDLYKNPTIKITLPEQVQNINITNVNLINADGELSLNGDARVEGNTIIVQIAGEQTKFKSLEIENTSIIIDAEISLNQKVGSSVENVVLEYKNEKTMSNNSGIQNKEVEIIAYTGLIETTIIPDYGIDILNNEGEKQAKLDLASEAKQVQVKNAIINNFENTINDVRILGTYPTEGATDENNVKVSVTEVSVEGIDESRVKIYYSENANATTDLENVENGWTTNIQNTVQVKKYLVVIDKLDMRENIEFNYEIQIPENLEYNQIAKLGTEVQYAELASEQAKIDLIELTIGNGAVLNAETKTYVGGKETEIAHVGELIKYETVITNTGLEDAKDVKAVVTIPEGTVYAKDILPVLGQLGEDAYIEENSDKKEISTVVEELKSGESITLSYYVRANADISENTTITNSVKLIYGEVEKETGNKEITLKPGKIKVSLVSVDDDGKVNSGYEYSYKATIENISGKNLSNVKLTSSSDMAEIETMSYTRYNGDEIIEDVEEEGDSIVLKNIDAGESVEIFIYAKMPIINNEEEMKISAIAEVEGETYSFEPRTVTLLGIMVNMTNTSANANQYVSSGEEILYNISIKNNGSESVYGLVLEQEISKLTTLDKIIKNGEDLETESYSEYGKVITINEDELKSNDTVNYVIAVKANTIPGNEEELEILAKTNLNYDMLEIETSEVTHILKPEVTNYASGEVSNENNQNSNSSTNGSENNSSSVNNEEQNSNSANNTNNEEQNSNSANNSNTTITGTKGVTNNTISEVITRRISGTAWLDENEDGKKDSSEKLLSGINVKLLDVNTNKIAKDINSKELTTVTTEEGTYSFANVPQGRYIVIFEYDTSNYNLTTYKANDVNETQNSNAVLKTVDLDGTEKTVAATDIIEISDLNVANLNLGLKEAKIFDLKLDKYITKVITKNSQETATQEFKDATLAKKEIDAKLLDSTTAVVEYKIVITNEGEVEGYARKIVDNIASGYTFSSDLNSDWYLQGGKLYNTSLANTKILPGESKELTLVLTKQLSSTNVGLINNTAEISESYNDQEITDIDSVSGNNDRTEDDYGSADVILSIKTGTTVAIISIVMFSIIVVVGMAYIIIKIVLKRTNI